MGNIVRDLEAMKTLQATRAIDSMATGDLPFGIGPWIPRSHDAAFKRAFVSLNHGDVRGFVRQGAKECSALGL